MCCAAPWMPQNKDRLIDVLLANSRNPHRLQQLERKITKRSDEQYQAAQPKCRMNATFLQEQHAQPRPEGHSHHGMFENPKIVAGFESNLHRLLNEQSYSFSSDRFLLQQRFSSCFCASRKEVLIALSKFASSEETFTRPVLAPFRMRCTGSANHSKWNRFRWRIYCSPTFCESILQGNTSRLCYRYSRSFLLEYF